MVKNWPSSAGDTELIPCQETEIPRVAELLSPGIANRESSHTTATSTQHSQNNNDKKRPYEEDQLHFTAEETKKGNKHIEKVFSLTRIQEHII